MRKTVAILDSDVHSRMQFIHALQGTYRVEVHNSTLAAVSAMQMERPSLILVGSQVGDVSGVAVAREMNREKRFAGIPIVYIADKQDTRIREQLTMAGIKTIMVKPIEDKLLLAFAGKLITAEIERGWEELPRHQRKALEETISAFNGVARDLANGRAPEMGPIAESCSALVDVVAQKELGPLLDKIRSHDNFTYVHSMRFAAFIALFARSIGLPKPMQVQVACGGLLHDVGMMTIPQYLVNKQEALTPSEWKQMQSHVESGSRLLAAMGQTSKGVQIILAQHHERLDGSGYPRGLKGDQLNELARMAAIIDVFCGLTDRRPYKTPLSPNAAFELMAKTMAGKLDLDLLPRFRSILLESVYTDEELREAS
jgi:HD-GYP domain-containing protein (c-di-GMP phosphodiesterase class II)